MGYRYGRGDSGETDLMGGGRVKKSHPRVAAYGAVDELSAAIGVVKTFVEHQDIQETLTRVQEHLFMIGANLSAARPVKGLPEVGRELVDWLDREVTRLESELPPIQRFIFAGGTKAAALAHLARTIARRAEREVVALSEVEDVSQTIIAYLNRLSTLLFAVARVINHRAGVPDPEWQR